ncbi:hypothetical protein [Halomonas sp. C22]|uniref:hypothetical protein n=1 Tax=Halomonas sp. C22 TaxID=2580567 RepID=UPI0011A91963|nr:hypothetical protein [Halomonas sp. C22]
MFEKMRRRFWISYRRAQKERREKPRYQVVGNGVMTMKASDVVQTKAFQEQLKASERLEHGLRVSET